MAVIGAKAWRELGYHLRGNLMLWVHCPDDEDGVNSLIDESVAVHQQAGAGR
jgi:hypothetical protein